MLRLNRWEIFGDGRVFCFEDHVQETIHASGCATYPGCPALRRINSGSQMPSLFLVPLYFNVVYARPNLVMWLVDDLGWGSVRFNGNSKVASCQRGMRGRTTDHPPLTQHHDTTHSYRHLRRPIWTHSLRRGSTCSEPMHIACARRRGVPSCPAVCPSTSTSTTTQICPVQASRKP